MFFQARNFEANVLKLLLFFIFYREHTTSVLF